MEREKVVVLCSGGFDSVTLMHHVSKHFKQNIVSVFFNYGQRNYSSEYGCAKKVSEKLGAEFICIDLPKFSWVEGCTLFDDDTTDGLRYDNETAYMPMRNLVFLSYALSIAESKGCTRVYSAIINVENDARYNDTKDSFVKSLRNLFNVSCRVKFETPFRKYTKSTVGCFAYEYGITKDDYFSCNYPSPWGTKQLPCGECGDCKELIEIEKHLALQKHPDALWVSNGFAYSKEFEKAFKREPITSMSIHNNMVCNSNCPHCYYGVDKPHDALLTTEGWKRVIEDAYYENGIKDFHFAGKEPFMTENIFELAEFISTLPGTTYDVVTNGILIPKYIDKIAKAGFKQVCLSIDELYSNGSLRSYSMLAAKNIKLLHAYGVPVSAYVNVHTGNYKDVPGIIKSLISELHVEDIGINPILMHGRAKEHPELILSSEQWAETLCEVFLEVHEGNTVPIEITSPITLLEPVKDNPFIKAALDNYIRYGIKHVENNVFLNINLYHNDYHSRIVVTADGYVLGDSAELSNPFYFFSSPGNVLVDTIKECIKRGKSGSINLVKHRLCKRSEVNDCQYCRGNVDLFDPVCYKLLFD